MAVAPSPERHRRSDIDRSARIDIFQLHIDHRSKTPLGFPAPEEDAHD